jgi:hypothetical protein
MLNNPKGVYDYIKTEHTTVHEIITNNVRPDNDFVSISHFSLKVI